MFHIDSFVERMFWCEILTFVYGINVALQNKKTTLVCVTKLSEGLKSNLRTLKENIVHDSIVEYFLFVGGLNVNFSS